MTKRKGHKLVAGAKPCEACPYRKDCPSGLWDASEYFKLVRYDENEGDTPPFGVFMCHDARDGEHVCKGWLDVHGPDQVCVRVAVLQGADVGLVDSPRTVVPLFESGREAALHGLTGSHIQKRAGKMAKAKQAKLEKRHPDIKRRGPELTELQRSTLIAMRDDPRKCWIAGNIAKSLQRLRLVDVTDRDEDNGGLWRCWINEAGKAAIA